MRLAGCNKFALMHTETDIETLMAPFEQQTVYRNANIAYRAYVDHFANLCRLSGDIGFLKCICGHLGTKSGLMPEFHCMRFSFVG